MPPWFPREHADCCRNDNELTDSKRHGHRDVKKELRGTLEPENEMKNPMQAQPQTDPGKKKRKPYLEGISCPFWLQTPSSICTQHAQGLHAAEGSQSSATCSCEASTSRREVPGQTKYSFSEQPYHEGRRCPHPPDIFGRGMFARHEPCLRGTCCSREVSFLPTWRRFAPVPKGTTPS